MKCRKTKKFRKKQLKECNQNKKEIHTETMKEMQKNKEIEKQRIAARKKCRKKDKK